MTEQFRCVNEVIVILENCIVGRTWLPNLSTYSLAISRPSRPTEYHNIAGQTTIAAPSCHVPLLEPGIPDGEQCEGQLIWPSNICRNLRTQQMSVLVLLCTSYTTCFGPYWWPSSGGL
jgi:hypothetical protein